jgi:Fe-S oxidoreductase
MPDLARQQAQRNVEALLPYAERGVPIVGIEPSCLLTLRDEYPDLLTEEPLRGAARTVAGQALLLDELLARLAADDPSVASVFRDDVRAKVVLHGHCHQKALAGMAPTLEALALAPGYDVELIDSPCCGMAGSFGFEAEHYQISRAMGALKLFPAVNAAPEEAVIAVTGVSCRQQIDHFTSRTPRHVVELLADALR